MSGCHCMNCVTHISNLCLVIIVGIKLKSRRISFLYFKMLNDVSIILHLKSCVVDMCIVFRLPFICLNRKMLFFILDNPQPRIHCSL